MLLSSDWEIFTLLILTILSIGVLSWLITKTRHNKPVVKKKIINSQKSKKTPEIKDQRKVSIFEKFDYLGTKIFHNDGKYTVIEDGISRNFNSLNDLPKKYQKMILEMQTQKFPGKKNSYYMENKNGAYSVVFPDGTRKNYKKYSDIPDKLKKILTGSG